MAQRGLQQIAKSISDAAWRTFRLILQSEAARSAKRESRPVGTGEQLTKVDPKHTSQRYSGCDSIVAKLLLVRVHDCPNCGLVLDRDHNAAINIKKAAAALRGDVVVTNTPEIPKGIEARNLANPGERATSPNPSGWGLLTIRFSIHRKRVGKKRWQNKTKRNNC